MPEGEEWTDVTEELEESAHKAAAESAIVEEIDARGSWHWIRAPQPPPYEITGKYLFFSPEQRVLLNIARLEIAKHGFHVAKVRHELVGAGRDYVLCLYDKDDSRKAELAARNRTDYDVSYRGWKRDEDTVSGKYSTQFLSRLTPTERAYFTRDKSADTAFVTERRRRLTGAAKKRKRRTP